MKLSQQWNKNIAIDSGIIVITTTIKMMLSPSVLGNNQIIIYNSAATLSKEISDGNVPYESYLRGTVNNNLG